MAILVRIRGILIPYFCVKINRKSRRIRIMGVHERQWLPAIYRVSIFAIAAKAEGFPPAV
jgi:hypothetical protein